MQSYRSRGDTHPLYACGSSYKSMPPLKNYIGVKAVIDFTVALGQGNIHQLRNGSAYEA